MIRLFLLVAFLISAGCVRSQNYRDSERTYTADSAYEDESNSRAEKMAGAVQPKKKIIFYPFMNATPFGDDTLGTFVSDELSRMVKETKRAIVPDTARVAANSRSFYVGDKVKIEPLIREGKQLGVNLIAVGRIKRVVYRKQGDDVGLFRRKKNIAAADVELRVFSVADKKEILMERKSGDSESSEVNVFGDEDQTDVKSQREELVRIALRNSASSLVSGLGKMFEKISWEGKIAKVSGARIYVNAGKASGLMPGDILKVLSPGEDVFDPGTGGYLGRSPGQVKGTLEVTDYIGLDGAVTRIQSGGNFFENDIVQLY